MLSPQLMDCLVLTSQPPAPPARDEFLRRVAWEIGEEGAADSFTPMENHVGLGMVSPTEGFAHWRLLPAWIEHRARQLGDGWRDCRMVLRLYDVTSIDFDGFNAHEMRDHGLPSLCGQMFFKLPRPGTWQLAEIGFVLRSREFVPAARSQAVAFSRNAPTHGSRAALLVNGDGVTEIENIWDQEKILRERQRPVVRSGLRIATFSFAEESGQLPRFVSELVAAQAAQGHETHLFVAGAAEAPEGVNCHAMDVPPEGTPVERAQAFAQAAQRHLSQLPPFHLMHLHEWMTGLVPRPGLCPVVMSVSSVEATRRNGTPVSDLSRAIEQQEREAIQKASLVLTSPWLCDRAPEHLGLEGQRVRAFPLEGRMLNQWELPLDAGAVKKEIGLGPLDRLIIYVGPLEHGAGVDLLVEALPVVMRRWSNLRLACVGGGYLHGMLEHRARELGVTHALRLLGHVDGPLLPRLLRASQALVLPSRHRVPFDDAVVDLARCAALPVITTHGGPAHLVRHEQTGLVTYDNPGSIVWAVDRLLGDAGRAEHMGRTGQRNTDSILAWDAVGRHYLHLCAEIFPELTTKEESP
jgi:glycosyltransferase involved in cell wall biosynthesis